MIYNEILHRCVPNSAVARGSPPCNSSALGTDVTATDIFGSDARKGLKEKIIVNLFMERYLGRVYKLKYPSRAHLKPQYLPFAVTMDEQGPSSISLN